MSARHGTLAGYKCDGCRCDDCTRANARAHKAYMMRHHRGERILLDPTGTRRRIQALVAIGWTYREIGEACGKTTREWAREVQKSARVHEDTATLIASVYDRLCMTVPTGKYRQRQIRRAQRNGWAPPLAWDDIDHDHYPVGLEVGDELGVDRAVVERILAGDNRVAANPAERREVVRRWVEAGRPVNELARLTGWKVERYGRVAA